MVLNRPKNIVALAGGVGGAKLVYGLSKLTPAEQFTVIGNVADDFELYGLHISPDLDTVMYTLAEIANPVTGWGLEGDTRHGLEMLARYGMDTWFGLGDRDMATHVLRTQWLRQGLTLTAITARLVEALGVRCRLLPVTDDPLATMVDTVEYGTLAFQEYFVRWRWQPVVSRVWFKGAETACVSAPTAEALRCADAVIICPSNPVLSIEPILTVPGVREALAARQGPCVVVSPFVGGQAVKGPAKKLMDELALPISPQGLADYYAEVVDGLMIDESDRGQKLTVDMPVLVTSTLMQTREDKLRLAGEVLEWVGSIAK
jgi:LPPG:FO 2-phospho-L-lactate transferase